MKNANRINGWSWVRATLLVAALAFSSLTGRVGASDLPAIPPSGTAGFLYRTNYHGWQDSIWLSNGKVEAIIVPAVGRVMQFRFAGAKDGPFWENAELSGKPTQPGAGTWLNFGGERVWPSPQASWSDIMQTNWPPPVGFDGKPAEAKIDGWVVTLIFPADKFYGMQVRRRIELAVDAPSMEIETRFEKVDHPTMDVGAWVITQLKDPLALYCRLQLTSLYPQGFQPMSDRLPPSLSIRNRLLALSRDPRNPHKLGIDVGSVVWMTDDAVLKIDSPRLPYREYPDGGASMEITTSPDPMAFVEVGMLSPVRQLRVGGVITQRSTYTLLHRTEVDPELEAAKLLKP